MTVQSGTWPKMTSAEEFRFLSELVLTRSSADHTIVSLRDHHAGTTRFANNQIVQNVDARRGSLAVTVAFGGRHGTSSTTNFTAGAVQDTLARAERIARVSPVDPEYLPPPVPCVFPVRETAKPETMAAGPVKRLEYANEAIGHCRMENIMAAGVVSSSATAVGIAADNGLFGYERRADARFSLTVQAGDATGWGAAAHRSIDHLRVQERTLAAIAKSKRGRDAYELSAGDYPVILEPAAVAGLWTWLIWSLDAKSYTKGTSPFAGKLGQPIVDERLTLRNVPDHDDLLGVGFTHEGLPSTDSVWIDRGILTQLAYDRFTAKTGGVEIIPTLEAPALSVEGPSAHSIQDLIKSTERGILVTNFWYIRPVNPRDLMLTGMTRDGTFLVEKGEVVSAVKNFRFHESPLRAFQRLSAWTAPMEAVNSETGKMLMPAIVLPHFHFSSVTRF
ncbi:MAG: TldE/PmbA family protein, Actinobacterial subgroup [Nitrospira sp.]|jgi:predicted Zn-dependent protease|nr:MAG: TldE/PmbA family protein, Actinobacterial subgroup [Nitrospira sp.]